MLVSTKGRYALRVMLKLAESVPGEYTLLESIADEECISEKYLENIVRTLVKAKLIQGMRGRGGGYRLTRDSADYSVGEILRAAEGSSLAPVACLDCKPSKCSRAAQCKALPLWEKLDTIICNYLDNTLLSDLLDPSHIGDFQI